MQMCTRCHKRIAVVFITKIENNQQTQEGLCLQCARQIGVKPVDDLLEKMGISEEDIEHVNEEMAAIEDNLPVKNEDDTGEEGGAPAIELPKIFQNLTSHLPKKNPAPSTTQKTPEKKRKYLSTYCQNLTAKAAAGELDRIVGRDRELERVIQILCRRQKNNPCLIGEPGVGKTAIAEALAVRIAENRVPYKLKDHEIMLLDLTALVAGTQFRGQFESRILGLLKEVEESGNVILVIDEVHNIVGAGEAEGSMNAANILKPALSRGEIQVIGATTLKEYRKYIEKDSALERRFQPVMVAEPSISETTEMLKAVKGYYEQFHGIRIPDEVLEKAAILSERYISDRFLPDKAIDLLDEASASLALSSPQLNELAEKERELRELGEEKSSLESKMNENADESQTEEFYQKIADLKVKELQLSKHVKELEDYCAGICLTEFDLASVIENWTGIPVSDISVTRFEQLDRLEERIKERIIGQDEAVDAISRAIRRKRAGVSARKSPISMIFAGPTGVGKTELVKVLAEILFHQPDTLIRLDMSEYMEKHSVSRMIGAPPGYVGYDEAGQLTEKIRRRPYSVILFDEIEKAHPDILNILLQVLDDGRITDAAGRVVNFENTVIVMTTNAGSDRSMSISGFSTDGKSETSGNTEKALLSFLRPEFLNRVDTVVTFRHLSIEDMTKIADLMLGEIRNKLGEKSITFSWDDKVARRIAEASYSIKYGARNMRREIEKSVEDKIAELIVAAPDHPPRMIKLVADGDAIVPYALS